MLNQSEDLMLSGETREISVLFADIRGFTQMASKAKPVDVVKILNKYLTVMSEAVIAEGGTLDKFLGDGIMAIFGAPLKHDDDPLRAVRAAVRIQKEVDNINKKRLKSGEKIMQVGIGITMGSAVVGNIGSPRRMDYTAIGDTVNMAFRLQSVAQGRQVILSEEVSKSVFKDFQSKALEPVIVKGKSEPMNVFSLIYR